MRSFARSLALAASFAGLGAGLDAGLGTRPAAAQEPPASTATAGETMTRIVPVETDASGHGATRDAAIANALANAVAQETGVTVAQETANLDAHTQEKLDVGVRAKSESNEQSQTAAVAAKGLVGTGSGSGGGTGSASTERDDQGQPTYASTAPAAEGTSVRGAAVKVAQAGRGAESTNKTETRRVQGASTESKQIGGALTASVSGGKVTRYTVLSVDATPDGGFDARVHAVLELSRREGGTGDSRRRITVAPFTGPAAAETLRDRLVMDLTQSRRFAVLDRANDADYWHEMRTIAESGSTEDEARIAKVVGADYILSGKLAVTSAKTTGHGALTTYQQLDLTGEVVSQTTASTLHTTAGSAEADFQLIEAATRQIVMADHFQVSGANMDAVAARISDDIVEAIYPPRLVSIADPTALVINEGGNGMKAGKRLRLMQAGEEMFDPYTHESLGRTERETGVIEVTDVQQRLSYAKLVSGQLPASADLARLRPLAAPATAVAAAGKTPAVRPAAARRKLKAGPRPEPQDDGGAGGGVKLPFDK